MFGHIFFVLNAILTKKGIWRVVLEYMTPVAKMLPLIFSKWVSYLSMYLNKLFHQKNRLHPSPLFLTFAI